MGCCMAFNKNVLNYVLPFPDKIAMHDSWIGLNASLIGKSYFLNTPLIQYRRHGKNTMASFKKKTFASNLSNQLQIIYDVSSFET